MKNQKENVTKGDQTNRSDNKSRTNDQKGKSSNKSMPKDNTKGKTTDKGKNTRVSVADTADQKRSNTSGKGTPTKKPNPDNKGKANISKQSHQQRKLVGGVQKCIAWFSQASAALLAFTLMDIKQLLGQLMKNYKAMDIFHAMLCFNLWACIYHDITGRPKEEFSMYVKSLGIAKTIETLQEQRDLLLESDFDKSILPSSSILHSLPVEQPEEKRKMLIFCNFGKRLPLPSMKDDPVYIKNTLDKFKENMERLWNHNYPKADSQIVKELRKISNIDVVWDPSVFTLPPHQYAENISKPYTFVKKFRTLASYIGNWCENEDFVVKIRKEQNRKWKIKPISAYFSNVNSKEYPDYNILTVVNKDWNKGRVICMESIGRNARAYQIMEPMTKILNKIQFIATFRNVPHSTGGENGNMVSVPIGGCSWTNQANHAWLAKVASETGRLATIDVEMASDSVTREVVELLWPKMDAMCRRLNLYSTYTLIEGKKVELPVAFTMGHGDTYLTESHIFKSLCIQACNDVGTNPLLISTVGDDIIIPVEAVARLVELCAMFGFIINDKKSWYTGHYRESCGMEAFDGWDVSPIYYPRSNGDVLYAELISLQHKLVDFPSADALLQMLIRVVHPTTTCSPVGSKYNDIWSRYLTESPVIEKDVNVFVKDAHMHMYDPVSCRLEKEGESHRPYLQRKAFAESVGIAIHDGGTLHGSWTICKFDLRETPWVKTKDSFLRAGNKLDMSFLKNSTILHAEFFDDYSLEEARGYDWRDRQKFILEYDGWFVMTYLLEGSKKDIQRLIIHFPFNSAFMYKRVGHECYELHTDIVPHYANIANDQKVDAENLAYLMTLAHTQSRHGYEFAQSYEIPQPMVRETLASSADIQIKECKFPV